MSAVYAFFVAVFVYKDMTTQQGAEGAARLGQHERDAALHHHQRGDVQLPDDLRADPAGDRPAWMLDKGLGVDRRSCCS